MSGAGLNTHAPGARFGQAALPHPLAQHPRSGRVHSWVAVWLPCTLTLALALAFTLTLTLSLTLTLPTDH